MEAGIPNGGNITRRALLRIGKDNGGINGS